MIRRGMSTYIPETTKIIIAQRIASVQEADMIIVMDNGRIVTTGTHEELMASSPIYRETYEQQTSGQSSAAGDRKPDGNTEISAEGAAA